MTLKLSACDETNVDRAARVAQEEAVITQAGRDIAAGRGLTDGQVESWLDGLETDENALLPVGNAGSCGV